MIKYFVNDMWSSSKESFTLVACSTLRLTKWRQQTYLAVDTVRQDRRVEDKEKRTWDIERKSGIELGVVFSVHYGVASLDKLYAGCDVGYHQPEAKAVVQEAHAADQLSVYQPVVLYHLFGHLRTILNK